MFSPSETKMVLDETFLITNKGVGATNDDDVDVEPNLNDLSKSVEITIRQSNQLNSGPLVESDLAGSDSKLQEGSAGSDSLGQDEQVYGPTPTQVHLSGAGLPYRYQFEALYLRFGQEADNTGSEHQINGRSFAAELQLMSFNSHLYKSFGEASTRPNGLLALSVLIDVEQEAHKRPTTRAANQTGQLNKLLDQLASIGHRGGSIFIQDLKVADLLPETSQFVTYEGSLTQPGCHESVNWLVLNKPLYITRQNVSTRPEYSNWLPLLVSFVVVVIVWVDEVTVTFGRFK